MGLEPGRILAYRLEPDHILAYHLEPDHIRAYRLEPGRILACRLEPDRILACHLERILVRGLGQVRILGEVLLGLGRKVLEQGRMLVVGVHRQVGEERQPERAQRAEVQGRRKVVRERRRRSV